ncbi:MAG TPA: hypothetical protein ENK98_03195, partial [Epsilonproteobacteria bacterium]|nr:hypothetical protein [Campylobacterota bacterium]
LFKEIGPFRSEESLSNAITYITYLRSKRFGLHCINKELENNVELSSIIEFYNSLFIAEALAHSAIKREESRGVHFRSDFPNKDDKNFQAASYINKLGHDYLKITYENAMKTNIWYSIKKYLILLKG